MWKKALWVYLGLFVIGILYLFVSDLIKGTGNVTLASLPMMLLSFLPAVTIAIGLRGKKVPILLTLFSLLLIAVPVVGMFNFDGFTLATFGKFLLFVPMFAGLFYFGYQRLRKNTT